MTYMKPMILADVLAQDAVRAGSPGKGVPCADSTVGSTSAYEVDE